MAGAALMFSHLPRIDPTRLDDFRAEGWVDQTELHVDSAARYRPRDPNIGYTFKHHNWVRSLGPRERFDLEAGWTADLLTICWRGVRYGAGN